ncbi:MAG: nucleotidyl transferase AbiEii/AbiGii toxin family protein [Nitrospirae bacterium]|nr:nucleotidyl transferase AbiEii/AbiGii toxin family protein [Nitrospirota bacterium]
MHKECFPEKGWKVLKKIGNIFKKYDAVLAGGTALAFQLGHRVSIDLDFFTVKTFRNEDLISAIRRTDFSFKIISEGEGYLIVDVEGIKISMFKYDYPFLEKPVRVEGIYVAGLLDIAAMKLIAISQRGTKRDFVDLYYVLQRIPFHIMADHMIKRFGRERISPVHIGKSLVYFSDAESNPEPEYARGKGMNWDKVKIFFRDHAKQFVLDLDIAHKKSGG